MILWPEIFLLVPVVDRLRTIYFVSLRQGIYGLTPGVVVHAEYVRVVEDGLMFKTIPSAIKLRQRTLSSLGELSLIEPLGPNRSIRGFAMSFSDTAYFMNIGEAEAFRAKLLQACNQRRSDTLAF
jgi:hypothetical protein